MEERLNYTQLKEVEEMSNQLKEMNSFELRNLERKVTSEIVVRKRFIKNIESRINHAQVLDVANDLHAERKCNTSASSDHITVKRGDTNLCKVYGAASSILNATALAHQITMIPDMLAIISRLMDEDVYAVDVRDQCRDLMETLNTGKTMEWSYVGKEKHRYKAYGDTRKYKLKKKES